MRDVAIVGGGPAGLFAARLLARRGFDVAVLEEHEVTGQPVHCTGVLAADAFDEFDLPAESLLNPLDTVRFLSPSGDHVEYSTPTVEAVVIDRIRFDRQLEKDARAAGATLLAGHRVTDVAVDTDGATVVAAGREPVRARLLLLAVGANYTLQRRLQLGLPALYLQSAQLELPAGRPGPVEVQFGGDVAPKGFAWTVPVKRPDGGYARIGLMAERNAAGYFARLLDRIAARWAIDLRGNDAGDVVPRRKMLPLAPIRRTFADRVLAIGDAAGLVKATTGGGIYYALVSAALAAETGTAALRSGRLDAASLRPYERAWRRRLGPELQAQLSLRMLANRMSDGDIESFFELARTDGILPIVRRTARFNRHRDVIITLFRHPPARRVLFRRLTAGTGARLVSSQ
jgi:digeranylgeranylglycerophospholipid reductase